MTTTKLIKDVDKIFKERDKDLLLEFKISDSLINFMLDMKLSDTHELSPSDIQAIAIAQAKNIIQMIKDNE